MDAQIFAINDVGIRRHLAADHGFAKAKTAVDDDFCALARRWIGGEQNARNFRRHHQLHHHGHGDTVLIDAVLMPVADGLGSPQRRPTIFYCGNNGVFAAHIQKRFLLAREGQSRQVFSIGRRSHSNRCIFTMFCLYFAVGGLDRCDDGGVHACLLDLDANDRGTLVEGGVTLLELGPCIANDFTL